MKKKDDTETNQILNICFMDNTKETVLLPVTTVNIVIYLFAYPVSACRPSDGLPNPSLDYEAPGNPNLPVVLAAFQASQ